MIMLIIFYSVTVDSLYLQINQHVDKIKLLFEINFILLLIVIFYIIVLIKLFISFIHVKMFYHYTKNC